MAELKYWGKQQDNTYAWIPIISNTAILSGSIDNDKLSADVKIGSLGALLTADKTSVTAAINSLKTRIDNLPTGGGTAVSFISGTSTFGGEAGKIVYHTDTETTDYKVVITTLGDTNGSIGEITVTNKTNTSFIVKNTGSNTVNQFDWIIIK